MFLESLRTPAGDRTVPPACEPDVAPDTEAFVSIDARLAQGDISKLSPEDQPAGEVKGMVYGRDTLISARERPEVVRALRRPPEQRLPVQVRLIVELMAR
jgi:hypothetical protein